MCFKLYFLRISLFFLDNRYKFAFYQSSIPQTVALDRPHLRCHLILGRSTAASVPVVGVSLEIRFFFMRFASLCKLSSRRDSYSGKSNPFIFHGNGIRSTITTTSTTVSLRRLRSLTYICVDTISNERKREGAQKIAQNAPPSRRHFAHSRVLLAFAESAPF